MKFIWDPVKERSNRQKHRLGFDLAQHVFSDPLVAIVFDRFENGDERFHAIGCVSSKCLLVVFVTPDPHDDDLIRVIGLRQATPRERSRYEEGEFR